MRSRINLAGLNRITLWAMAGAVTLGWSIAAPATHADIIYNTYGADGTYTLAGPQIISKGTFFEAANLFYPEQSIAVPFTVASPATLSKVTVGTYFYYSPLGLDRMVVSVMGTTLDGEPDPANVLETFQGAFGAPDNVGPSFSSTVQPLLSPGNTYWLAVEAKDAATLGLWNANPDGLTGITSHNAGSSFFGWENSVPVLLPAAKIEATPVPEPASLGLLTITLVGIAFRRRRSSSR